MSAAELEEMAGADDLQSVCPAKVVKHETLTPIPPEPVDEPLISESFRSPRWWEYRVC